MGKLVPHFLLSCGLITITKVFIKTVLNHSHYASIVLEAFRDLLCSKLCRHNRPGPNYDTVSPNCGCMGSYFKTGKNMKALSPLL